MWGAGGGGGGDACGFSELMIAKTDQSEIVGGRRSFNVIVVFLTSQDDHMRVVYYCERMSL